METQAIIQRIMEIPADLRALATGIFNMGAGLGAIIAPPAVAWLLMSYSWHAAFLFTGGIGFIWVLIWLMFYRPGRLRAGVKVLAGEEWSSTGAPALPWRALFGYRQV